MQTRARFPTHTHTQCKLLRTLFLREYIHLISTLILGGFASIAASEMFYPRGTRAVYVYGIASRHAAECK